MAMMLAPLTINRSAMPVIASGDRPFDLSNTQNINPWTWVANLAHSQFSFFTVNLGRSSAPEVEADILEDVGSYGRQLGRISDVLEILVKRLPRESLNEDELAAVEDFSSQMREIKRIKERRLAQPSRG
jgi:hypothetical protein